MRFVTCIDCKRVHVGISLERAIRESKEDVIPVERYLECAQCKASCSSFDESGPDDELREGIVPQIVAHADLPLDRAEMDELRIDNHMLLRAEALISGVVELGYEAPGFREWLQDYAKAEERRDA